MSTQSFVRVAALLGAMTAATAAETQPGDTLLHARVSFASASALIKGASDADWSYATTNSLVLAGDTLWADNEGMLEVEFSGGTFLRFADASKAEVMAVPPSGALRGLSGSFYVQRISRSQGAVTFETPVGFVDIDGNSQVRIDVVDEGATTVTVRWGNATIRTAGPGEPVAVGQGLRSYIDPGYLPSQPEAFDRSIEDAFDTWNRERARLLAVGMENVPILATQSKSTVYSAAPVGVSDLNSHGEWVYVDDSYHWRPTAIREYVPYRSGYWSYIPSCGYTWIEPYPFSYVTTHYGYWNYHNDHGWLWRYEPYWAPARCATVRYGDYFLWSPVNHHGRPAVCGTDYYSVGGLNFGVGFSSYGYANDILNGRGQCHAYNSNTIGPIVAENVYIWNINTSNSPYRDRTYQGSTLRVRDYDPVRVMRGPSSAGVGNLLASERATALETRASSRLSNAWHTGSGGAVARTGIAESGRRAAVRAVHLDSSAIQDTPAAIQRASRTSSNARRLVAERSGTLTITNDEVGAEIARQSRYVPREDRSARGESSRAGVRNSAREVSRETAMDDDASRGADAGNRVLRNGVVPKPESSGTDPGSERGESRRVVRGGGDEPSSAEVVTGPRSTREAAPESDPAPRRMTVPRETLRQDRPAPESPSGGNVDAPPAERTRGIERPTATRTREAAPESDPAPRRVTAPRESRRAETVSESPRGNRIGADSPSRGDESGVEFRNPAPRSSSRLAESSRPVQSRDTDPGVRSIPRRDPVPQEAPAARTQFDPPQSSGRFERPEAPERPEIQRRDAVRPEVQRPEAQRPELQRPEVQRPEMQRPEIQRAPVERPQANVPSNPRSPERPSSPRDESSRFRGRP